METSELQKIKASLWNEHCPSRQVLDMIADKWTALVVLTLAGETKRYSQLQHEICGISHKMLSQTLRQLEQSRLINRQVYPTVPPQVEYSLTERGETLLGPLSALANWAETFVNEANETNEKAG